MATSVQLRSVFPEKVHLTAGCVLLAQENWSRINNDTFKVLMGIHMKFREQHRIVPLDEEEFLDVLASMERALNVSDDGKTIDDDTFEGQCPSTP